MNMTGAFIIVWALIMVLPFTVTAVGLGLLVSIWCRNLQRLFLEGAGILDIWQEAAYLFALGAGLFVFAWYGFKRK